VYLRSASPTSKDDSIREECEAVGAMLSPLLGLYAVLSQVLWWADDESDGEFRYVVCVGGDV